MIFKPSQITISHHFHSIINMIPQLETLISQRFFYLNESGDKGVEFNGKICRWGYVEVSLPLMRIYF